MWPVGQAVKTAASHAANVGSIPARVTTSFVEKALDKGKKSEYNDLSLRKTVRREKSPIDAMRKVFFAYFLFQKKVRLHPENRTKKLMTQKAACIFL